MENNSKKLAKKAKIERKKYLANNLNSKKVIGVKKNSSYD